MKISFTIVFLLIKITLWCQSYQIAPDSLIRKYHVKKITAFKSDSGKKERPQRIYEFDSTGNLITTQWFQQNADKDTDERISVTMCFYQNKLLVKTISVGYRENVRMDTTIFTYDHLDRLLSKVSTTYAGKRSVYKGFEGYERDMTNVIQYKYLNDTIVIARKEESDGYRNRIQDFRVNHDTLIYNRDKLLLCEIKQLQKVKITYVYNNRKQMISKTSKQSNPASVIATETFIYKEGRLIREEILLYTKDGSYTNSRTLDYINNENGLVEVYKLNRLNSIIYRYEYY